MIDLFYIFYTFILPMKSRSILHSILILSLGFSLIACSSQQPATPPPEPSPSAPSGKISASLPGTESLKITAPEAGAVVSAPLVVKGEAKGSWYFEASFPIRLVDEQGNELARATAQAQGDWMTDAYVRFEATFDSFDSGTATAGKLVFEKDNPSGLPENAESFEMPVQF